MEIFGFYPNILVLGEPGSGKSYGSAQDALAFPGATITLDPHSESLGKLVLLHKEGNVLYDRLDDLDHWLGYDLLRPSTHQHPGKRLQENQRRVRVFVDVLMRRRGGDIATSPLMEENVFALLLLFMYQSIPKTADIIPYGFRPHTPQFRALIRDCTLEEVRHKFEDFPTLKPKALRAEVGSAERLVNGVFSSPSFQLRCRGGFDIGAFIQKGGTLIVERGDESEDVCRTIFGGICMLVADFCERRKFGPPARIYLDECTNARTAGEFEEKKSGETRKKGLSWYFICQWLNLPNPEGFLQNCQRKEIYRSNYDLARKIAALAAPGFPLLDEEGEDEETHAKKVGRLASKIVRFRPGERLVTDRDGSRIETVQTLRSPFPDWPGLEEGMIAEKILWMHQNRPEFRTCVTQRTGEPRSDASSTDSDATRRQQSSSPEQENSPAQRWKRRRRKPGSSSTGNDGEER